MYSPPIADHLIIPPIYRPARAHGQHMTTLVSEALARYLAEQGAAAQPTGPAPQGTDHAPGTCTAARFGHQRDDA